MNDSLNYSQTDSCTFEFLRAMQTLENTKEFMDIFLIKPNSIAPFI